MKVEQTPSSHAVVRTALLHDICQLGQALTFFKHECLHLPKADISWSQGLLHLVLLFHFQDSQLQSWGHALRDKLQSMGLYPLQYSSLQFADPWIGDVVLVLDITASPTR